MRLTRILGVDFGSRSAVELESPISPVGTVPGTVISEPHVGQGPLAPAAGRFKESLTPQSGQAKKTITDGFFSWDGNSDMISPQREIFY